MWLICYKFAQLLLLLRLFANAAQQVSCFKHKYQKYFVELNFLSPLSLIVLENFVRLKIPFFGFSFLNSPCMIVQRRISTIRNKITRSFFHRKIEKRKMQKCILLIFWSLPWGHWGFEIEALRKETEILVNQIFTFSAFVFHLKWCYWFYYCGFITLLL